MSSMQGVSPAMERLLWCLILVGAFGLRATSLAAGGLWQDEGYSLLQSELAALDIIRLNAWDPHPPLYLLTLRAWRLALGTDLLTAKALSVLWGVAGVAGAGFAARAHAGRVAGALVLFFVAVHPAHIHYSREVRGYALVFLGTCLALGFWLRWQKHGGRAALLGWVVSSWVAVNTEYFAWYFVGMLSLAVWIEKRSYAFLLATAALVCASALPLAALVKQVLFVHNYDWVRTPDLHSLWATAKFLSLDSKWSVLTVGVFGLVGIASVLRNETRGNAVALLGMLALPLVVFCLSQVASPAYLDRHFLIVLAPVAMLVAVGVTRSSERFGRRPAVELTFAAVVIALTLAPLERAAAAEKRADRRGQRITEHIQRHYKDGDIVLYSKIHQFVPSIAQHPVDWHEYLWKEEPSIALRHLVMRRVVRESPTPGEFRRLWLVAPLPRSHADLDRESWFIALDPKPIPELSVEGISAYSLGGWTAGDPEDTD